MWSGCGCALWSDPGCSWNISLQAFAGPACVTASTTRVASRHLTSFTSQAAPPQIKTLSAKDLVAITPEDIVHLRELVRTDLFDILLYAISRPMQCRS
jgi:hypothetical protein